MKFVIYLRQHVHKIFHGPFGDIQAILADPEFRKRKIRDNLYACSFISCLLCIIALTGVIGTYAPNAAGAVLPAINATAVYGIIFSVNVLEVIRTVAIRGVGIGVVVQCQQNLAAFLDGVARLV